MTRQSYDNPVDFYRMLSGGDKRSIGKADKAADDTLRNPDLFGNLFELIFCDDEIVRMRAADAVEKITRQRPDLIQKYKRRLFNEATQIRQQEVRWHLAQLFSRLKLTSAERKKLFSILQDFLTDDSRIVKTFAMEALADIARQDDRLKPAIVSQLHELTQTGSPAMKSRGKKLLAKLAQSPEKTGQRKK